MTSGDQAATPPGALNGFSVLDLSFFAPGRAATVVLGDLGADVTCVEVPRGLRPGGGRLTEDTTSRWMFYGRNKKSITLNLKSDAGKRVFRELAKDVDVIIESYKPGNAKKLGVDYDTVRGFNPRVVYCSVSGFGQTGPYVGYAGHEPNYQGLSGVLAHNHLAGEQPHMLPALVGDLGGGAMSAVMAVLAALLYRERSGEGQYIDVAVASGILPLLGSLPYAQWLGEADRATSFSSGHRATFRAFQTKDGNHVGFSPVDWARFCRVIGREDLIGMRTGKGEDPRLLGILTEVFASRTRQEWVELNDREDITVTAVLNDIYEVENDAQMKHRDVIVEIDYAPMGKVKQIKTPFQMSRTPPTVRWMPRYGEHTEEVLAKAGFGPDQILAMRQEGVIE
jgi:crotonobetainyl-CoA:carnitine CoA-transferase CaiB-like acyl-CoA transferase